MKFVSIFLILFASVNAMSAPVLKGEFEVADAEVCLKDYFNPVVKCHQIQVSSLKFETRWWGDSNSLDLSLWLPPPSVLPPPNQGSWSWNGRVEFPYDRFNCGAGSGGGGRPVYGHHVNAGSTDYRYQVNSRWYNGDQGTQDLFLNVTNDGKELTMTWKVTCQNSDQNKDWYETYNVKAKKN